MDGFLGVAGMILSIVSQWIIPENSMIFTASSFAIIYHHCHSLSITIAIYITIIIYEFMASSAINRGFAATICDPKVRDGRLASSPQKPRYWTWWSRELLWPRDSGTQMDFMGYICIWLYMIVYVYMYMYICICIYVYTYIYDHMYICTYIPVMSIYVWLYIYWFANKLRKLCGTRISQGRSVVGFVLNGVQWCHSGEHEALSLSHIWRVAYQKGFSQWMIYNISWFFYIS